MIIFLAGAPCSSSQTLNARLENFFQVKALTLKTENGIGHLTLSINQSILNEINNRAGEKKTILFYQHLFPTTNNLKILDNLFGIDNINFIVTYRNIFETLNNLFRWKENKKRSALSIISPFYDSYDNFVSKKYGINLIDILLIINFYAHWFKIIDNKYIRNIHLINYEDNINNIEIINKGLTEYLKKTIKLDRNITKNVSDKKEFEIPNELKEIVVEYCNSFTDINFKKIGI